MQSLAGRDLSFLINEIIAEEEKEKAMDEYQLATYRLEKKEARLRVKEMQSKRAEEALLKELAEEEERKRIERKKKDKLRRRRRRQRKAEGEVEEGNKQTTTKDEAEVGEGGSDTVDTPKSRPQSIPKPTIAKKTTNDVKESVKEEDEYVGDWQVPKKKKGGAKEGGVGGTKDAAASHAGALSESALQERRLQEEIRRRKEEDRATPQRVPPPGKATPVARNTPQPRTQPKPQPRPTQQQQPHHVAPEKAPPSPKGKTSGVGGAWERGVEQPAQQHTPPTTQRPHPKEEKKEKKEKKEEREPLWCGRRLGDLVAEIGMDKPLAAIEADLIKNRKDEKEEKEEGAGEAWPGFPSTWGLSPSDFTDNSFSFLEDIREAEEKYNRSRQQEQQQQQQQRNKKKQQEDERNKGPTLTDHLNGYLLQSFHKNTAISPLVARNEKGGGGGGGGVESERGGGGGGGDWEREVVEGEWERRIRNLDFEAVLADRFLYTSERDFHTDLLVALYAHVNKRFDALQAQMAAVQKLMGNAQNKQT